LNWNGFGKFTEPDCHIEINASKTSLLSNQCRYAIDMELRQLRYFLVVGEEQHYGRAAKRLRVAQPALSRQIQSLEQELGFTLFERLPRGVRISAAGKVFLQDARIILNELNDATSSAKRIASGQSGILRVGFVESISWHGVVPDSLRRFRERLPDAELRLKPLSSLEQVAAIKSNSLDVGFAVESANPGEQLTQIRVSTVQFMLAVPNDHKFTEMKNLRLKNLIDAPFIWFPRRLFPAIFDRLMAECVRGGLLKPRIVQEAEHETMLLGLVACRLGVAFVSSDSRWRCPPRVRLLPVIDLNFQIPFALMWRKENKSPLLAKFREEVEVTVQQRGGTEHFD
jgi:DNA-binding transcriptional LysR family regulator